MSTVEFMGENLTPLAIIIKMHPPSKSERYLRNKISISKDLIACIANRG